MKAKMTHAARRELVDPIRSRYRAASEVETYMDARIAERDAKHPAAAEGRF
jgi:transcription elongation factor GreA-like protein